MGNKERYGIIYKIENTVNGKCYIGQTTRDFNKRYHYGGKGIEKVYNYHKKFKEYNRDYNDHLLRSIEKYGFEAFDVIEEFDIAYSKEKLNDLEKKYIKEFDCINNGYNNKEGGSDGKLSEEAKIRISEKAKERYKNCEAHPMYGKQHSKETRRKIGEKSRERGKDPEYRSKMSESLKGKLAGENNPNYGNHKLAGKNHPMARKVICLNDSKIFNTINECAEYYKSNRKTVRLICQGEQKSTRTGLVFAYYDEYIQQKQTA